MPDEVRNFGHDCHVDMTFCGEPPLGAVLHDIETPPVGGDTLFANFYRVWQTLSDGMKAMLSQMCGLHDPHEPGAHSQQYRDMKLQVRKDARRVVTAHQMSRIHPVTGRESLLISPSYWSRFEGLTNHESRMILDHLKAHTVREVFTCRFRWTPGSVAVWDNRCLIHQALEDDLGAMFRGKGFRRVMRRATISV